jgi:hypothetical protein
VLNRPISAHAHYFAGCNAFFSPINRGIHFGDFNDPGGCGGTALFHDGAEDADVIIHEYGHAIHDDQVPGWGFGPYPLAEEAGAMGEGFGDFLAGVMNNDPCIAEYLSFSNSACGGSNGLRWLQNTMTYPAGYEACPNASYDGMPGGESEEVHCGGQLWGGALWDLVEALGGGSPTQASRDMVMKLVLESHFYLDQVATFSEAASAICMVDDIINDGANAAVIASTFSARGISSAPCINSDFPSLFMRVLHTFSGDLNVDVKVGANPNTPVCGINFGDPNTGLGADNFYTLFQQLGPCAGFLPPTVAQPWWLVVQDVFTQDIGSIQAFEVLLAGGTRCRSGDTPIPIPDAGPAVMAKVDCTIKVAAPSSTDTDLDGFVDAADNCPGIANPDQANAGGSALGDACDGVDTDGDFLADNAEYFCGSPRDNGALVPERLDTAGDDDGDGSLNEPLPGGASLFDCDEDGYSGAAEASIYFPLLDRDQDPCGNDGWPANLHDEPGPPLPTVNTLDIFDVTSYLAPDRRLDTSPGDTFFDVRWDLVPGPDIFLEHINIQDVTALFGGTPAFPPMFGFATAYGRTCPSPP